MLAICEPALIVACALGNVDGATRRGDVGVATDIRGGMGVATYMRTDRPVTGGSVGESRTAYRGVAPQRDSEHRLTREILHDP